MNENEDAEEGDIEMTAEDGVLSDHEVDELGASSNAQEESKR